MRKKTSCLIESVDEVIRRNTLSLSCSTRVALWFFVVSLLTGINACGKPDTVEKKDGYSWIPIADTAFLIQDKTWLKGYSRKATDGTVADIELHAMAPTMQPWSPEIHQAMYLPGGINLAAVIINVKTAYRSDFHKIFSQFPQSRHAHDFPLVEEPSEFAELGLRKFREVPYEFKDGPFKGQKMPNDTVFFEKVEQGKVKYYIRCDDNGAGYKKSRGFCYLSFPYRNSLEVELTYWNTYLPHSVAMADTITEKLKEFEAAGRVILVKKTTKFKN